MTAAAAAAPNATRPLRPRTSERRRQIGPEEAASCEPGTRNAADANRSSARTGPAMRFMP